MKKDAILCVDDEAIILLALKQELRLNFKDQYIIETALNVQQARDIIDTLSQEGTRVAMIICDWLMPGIKGDEFLSSMRIEHPEIQLLVITGHADKEALEIFRSQVGARILFKPWKSEELISAIKDTIHR
jgi:DNA-binding NtrC family response regulator